MADKENTKTAQPFSEEQTDKASHPRPDAEPARADLADAPDADASKVTKRQE